MMKVPRLIFVGVSCSFLCDQVVCVRFGEELLAYCLCNVDESGAQDFLSSVSCLSHCILVYSDVNIVN